MVVTARAYVEVEDDDDGDNGGADDDPAKAHGLASGRARHGREALPSGRHYGDEDNSMNE